MQSKGSNRMQQHEVIPLFNPEGAGAKAAAELDTTRLQDMWRTEPLNDLRVSSSDGLGAKRIRRPWACPSQRHEPFPVLQQPSQVLSKQS